MAHAFLIVIPSIRQNLPRFAENMAQVRKTFSHPTEFLIEDGIEGKPAALNRTLAEQLPPSPAEIYVTMDDDYIPGMNWQSKVLQAFQDIPTLGVASLWVGDDPHLQRVIGTERLEPWAIAGSTRYRRVQRGHHIAGAMLAYRREVALAVGPQPITGEKYQIWEDAWRGRRVQSLGWDLAFIEADLPEFVSYDDPPEYDTWRAEQVAASRKNQDFWLRDSGIPDPWHLRLRRWVARIRGRGSD